jgi:cytochrome c oxidase subunit II
MNGFLTPLRFIFTGILSSASNEANDINNLYIQFLIVAGIIGLLIAFLVIGGAILYRSKDKEGEPRQVSGNKRLEIIWTVIPILIVSYFLVQTIRVMAQINRPIDENTEPDIVIIGHQWWWDIRYPKLNVITANELHIPAGKKFSMRIESADVIHDWWVPELGRKMDAIPGKPNFMWIEANKEGSFQGACSEFCGAQHAWMRILVIAESPENFDRWVNDQQKTDSLPASDLEKKGALLFREKTCPNCHAIAGTGATAHIGPDLSHLGSRQTLLSGMKPNNDKNLSLWLTNPQNVKEGANMPDFIFSKDEVDQLTAYLEGLK